MKSSVIGIDIGGTNLRFALVDVSGAILERRRTSSRIEEGRDSFCSRLVAGINELKIAAGSYGSAVEAVGIGIPGLIGRDGMIYSSVNMLPLEGFNLGSFLEEKTGLPSACGNDANVIALGEQRYGAGRHLSSYIVVTIGTGLGSGLILDGKLWTGISGFAAEFGHVTVQPGGLQCPCGNRGCLEQYVSAGAIVRYAKELLPSESLVGADAEKIAILAREGNLMAKKIFENVGSWLGIALASLVSTLNLESAIIGGGVAASLDLLRPSLMSELSHRCFPQLAADFSVLQAQLGDDAGLLGSASLARARMNT